MIRPKVHAIPNGEQEAAKITLNVRFTVSTEVAMEEAADQVVETDSSAMTIKTIARITMQPLPRYGKARFINLIWTASDMHENSPKLATSMTEN